MSDFHYQFSTLEEMAQHLDRWASSVMPGMNRERDKIFAEGRASGIRSVADFLRDSRLVWDEVSDV